MDISKSDIGQIKKYIKTMDVSMVLKTCKMIKKKKSQKIKKKVQR